TPQARPVGEGAPEEAGSPAVVVVVELELGSDLAARPLNRVDVGVGLAGADRADELVELAGRDALSDRADDVSRPDRAADRGRGRRACLRAGGPVAEVRAEEDGDA